MRLAGKGREQDFHVASLAVNRAIFFSFKLYHCLNRIHDHAGSGDRRCFGDDDNRHRWSWTMRETARILESLARSTIGLTTLCDREETNGFGFITGQVG